jgi:hypothetical protein
MTPKDNIKMDPNVDLCVQVIEEVDVHVILTTCPKLERLVLSGCGNVVPPTCPGFDCDGLRMRRLRLLFFADGDDFSWDHDVPPCFWRATLAAGRGRRVATSGGMMERKPLPLYRSTERL